MWDWRIGREEWSAIGIVGWRTISPEGGTDGGKEGREGRREKREEREGGREEGGRKGREGGRKGRVTVPCLRAAMPEVLAVINLPYLNHRRCILGRGRRCHRAPASQSHSSRIQVRSKEKCPVLQGLNLPTSYPLLLIPLRSLFPREPSVVWSWRDQCETLTCCPSQGFGI